MTRKLITSMWFGAALVLTAIASLISCSEDSGVEPIVPDPVTVEVTIGLASSSALPGTEVVITGLSSTLDLSEVYAIVTEQGAATAASTARVQASSTVAFVGRREDGTPYMFAPLKPAEFLTEGIVDIILTGGGITSNTVSLTILALPPATVTVQDLVTNLQDLLTTWLEVHGITREDLRAADPATMPSVFWPLWQAHEILDSPTNPNSMRALADGPIPFFNNEVIDFDVVNRMLSQTDIVASVANETMSVDSLNISPAPAPINTGNQANNVSRLLVALACVPPTGSNISDAASLSSAMEQGRLAENTLSGATGELLKDWSTLAGVLGIVPQLKGGATAVSGGITIFKLANEAAAGMLPTTFDYGATDFDLSNDQTKYNEDEVFGFWFNFKVTAISKGWSLEKNILQSILKLTPGGLGNALPGLGDFGKNLTSWGITNATKAAAEAAGVDEGETVSICPGSWRIDVSDPEFSKSEIAFGTSFVMSDHESFDTKEPGVSTLKLKTADGKFGGAFPATKLKEIEVLTIEVTVDPADVRLDPDQVQAFTATVANAENVEVKWDVPPPLIQVGQPTGNSITLQAPPQSANWTSIVNLGARSQADAGAREGKIDSDPREGFSVISPNTANIRVSPDGLCVPLAKTQDFTATVTGLNNTDVTWSASNGTFAGNTYKAPGSEDLNVVITATSVENTDIKGTATVEVSDCTCSWSAVTGVGSYAGKWAAWNSAGLGQIGMSPGDGSSDYPIISILTAELFTGTGPYTLIQASFQLSGDAEPYFAIEMDDPPATLPTLLINGFDGKKLTGTLSGDLVQIIPNGAEEPTINVISVIIEFRAEDLNQNACPGYGAISAFRWVEIGSESNDQR